MENILFQTSLVAAFVAGMVALFAPCCITFLLPAYLGSVFKEKEKILLATLIFGLGIFVVLLPAVLGVTFISLLLFRYHDVIYIFGGLVMIMVSILTFLGIKLPMPNLPNRDSKKTDMLSIFTLGIFSGITSACCAPVLIGILTLTFLSPNFFGALTVGAVYVLGMITPLFLISLFLSGKISSLTILRKQILSFNLFNQKYSVTLSNFIASIIFLITGLIILTLTLQGRLAMGNSMEITKTVQNIGVSINSLIGNNLLINILFILIVGFLFYKISKKI